MDCTLSGWAGLGYSFLFSVGEAKAVGQQLENAGAEHPQWKIGRLGGVQGDVLAVDELREELPADATRRGEAIILLGHHCTSHKVAFAFTVKMCYFSYSKGLGEDN